MLDLLCLDTILKFISFNDYPFSIEEEKEVKKYQTFTYDNKDVIRTTVITTIKTTIIKTRSRKRMLKELNESEEKRQKKLKETTPKVEKVNKAKKSGEIVRIEDYENEYISHKNNHSWFPTPLLGSLNQLIK